MNKKEKKDEVEKDLDLVIAWSDEEEFVIKEIQSLKEAIKMHKAVTHHATLHLSIMEKRLKEIKEENERA